jgi:hypothetical protein
MGTSVKRAFASMTQLLTAMSEHFSGADIVRAEAQQKQEAQQRMGARIDALRKGFTAIRDRHEELSGRISELGRHRV